MVRVHPPASDLSGLFTPRHVAFVGVSRRQATLGGLALSFALARPGKAQISVVHPDQDELLGVPCARSLSSVVDRSGPVDVAFLSVPGDAVVSLIPECAESGVNHVIVGSSGWAEVGEDGARRQAALVEAAATHEVRVLGPNTNGLWNAVDGLSLGFNTSHEYALRPGGIGVVGQTGAVLGSFLAGIDRAGGGVAYAVSTGNEADIDAADCFEFMAGNPNCRVIVLLMDRITRPDQFERAAQRARSLGKPIIAVTFGRSIRGRHAAELHSSRIAGGARARSAWLRSLGIAEASDLESAMFAATLLDSAQLNRGGGGLGVVSTSGAGAALIADVAEDWGVELADFSAHTSARLQSILTFTSPFNPLDLAGHGNDAKWLADAFDAVFEDENLSAVALLATLLPPKARGVAPVVSAFAEAKRRHDRPACAYAVGPLSDEHRSDLLAAGIAVADSGPAMLSGFAAAMTATHSLPRQLPKTSDLEDVAALAQRRDTGGETLLVHDTARDELEKRGVPFVRETSITAPVQAEQAWTNLGSAPVAMKLMDPALPHKASASGLELHIATADEANAAAHRLFARAQSGDARVLMQVMMPIAIEIFVGTVDDPQAGPVIAVGRGGSDVEAAPEVTVELAPVSIETARAMLLAVAPISNSLATLGQRLGREPQTLVDDAAAVVERVSALAASARGVVDSIDINPLIFTQTGELAAVDVRIQLRGDSK